MAQETATTGSIEAQAEIRVPAGHGRALRLAAGERLEIVAVEGPQVADLWAFAAADPSEHLSTAHTRSCLDRLSPRVGEAFYSNLRRPLLRVVADSSPGVHDLLLSACDAGRYRLLGHEGPHRTCVDNLAEALSAIGVPVPEIPPSPVNVFERVSIAPDGTLAIEAPTVRPGEALCLCAETDLVLAISACPMDIVPTNGADLRPKPVLLRRRPGSAASAGPAPHGAGRAAPSQPTTDRDKP